MTAIPPLTGMHTKTPLRPGETLFALALVLFSAAAFWQAQRISGFAGLATAGTFPMLASATMLASSLVVLAGSLRNNPDGPGTEPADPAGQAKILPAPVIITTGLVAAYVMLIPLFGFMLSSGGFLFVSFWYLWRRGWLISLVLALTSLAAIHAVFRLVFQVVLPAGSLVRGVF